ncbi:MAG TPA: signal peptidase I [Nocardioidaceae bacterium]|nr:signal peptidase I [Nocardioidaceae bacterium]
MTPARFTTWAVARWTVVGVLLTTTAFMVASYLLGWRLLVVESGSMAPTYPVGSLAVVTSTDAGALVAGRSIVFESQNGSGAWVSHRVVRRVETAEGLFFETRGDANPAADPLLVPARDVRGTVEYAVPRAGHVLGFLSRQPVTASLVVAPALWLAISAAQRRRRTAGHVSPPWATASTA